MFSALLLTLSVIAVSRFALYYWRSVVAGVAAQPVSDRLLSAAKVEQGQFTADHFRTFAQLHTLTPDLNAPKTGLGLVGLYFKAVEVIGSLAANAFPSVAAWSERERIMCAQYAAVQVNRRLLGNLEFASGLRSI
jgi:hypothetical protein